MDGAKYVALFKGLNVGGKSSVPMRDLRQLFLDLGFGEVQSYIQSGNVCFRAQDDPEAIRRMLRDAFAVRFGFDSSVMLRSAGEMSRIVEGLPFSPAEISAAEAVDPRVVHLYACFLSMPFEDAQGAPFRTLNFPGERLREEGATLYLLLERSIRESKLVAAIAKAQPDSTIRNWKTVQKLAQMLEAGQ